MDYPYWRIWYVTLKPDGTEGMLGLEPAELAQADAVFEAHVCKTGVGYFDFLSQWFADLLDGARVLYASQRWVYNCSLKAYSLATHKYKA